MSDHSTKQILMKELRFINSVFSILSVPDRIKGEINEIDKYVYLKKNTSDDHNQKNNKGRAEDINELEKRLQKIKSDKKFCLKNKLLKKSLSNKRNKKVKILERKLTTNQASTRTETQKKDDNKDFQSPNMAKPVFNSDGKLVFSKFDFTAMGNKTVQKNTPAKEPKNMLKNLQAQEEHLEQLRQSGANEKASGIKSKIAWRNALARSEGQKIKDDPLLLKKSIKNLEQQKKQSKKRWDERIQNVTQKKQDRQKKRQDNISKKSKEKKAKKIKSAAKRGRVVI